MTPLHLTLILWALWVVSWVLAATWTRRTAARPSLAEEAANRIPTAAGYVLIFIDARVRVWAHHRIFPDHALWRTGAALGWAMAAAAALGFAFCWWARITLGALWSANVTRKDDHRIVEQGPYRLVRHPIYTGLLLASLATALQLATPIAFVGFGLVTLGFWLKARLEERFLVQGLGPAAYDDYRRRTPMLIPFWPPRR